MTIEARHILAIAIGGALGSVLRYLSASFIDQIAGANPFPWGIFIVNLVGSFLIGFLSHMGGQTKLLSETAFLGLTIGMLGGFTTFATFSHDIFSLLTRGHFRLAMAYALLSVLICLTGVWLGYAAGKWIWPPAELNISSQ